MPQLEAVLERLKSLHPKTIDLSLERMQRILAALQHPERQLPPVIHVAGTNGKGSVVAFLRAMLEAAGLRVHVYTSPHLVHFAERIRLAGTLIDDAALVATLDACAEANAGHPITFFEITTAAALLAFSRTPADVVLLETGMGGRLDATNVIPHPAVTVITRISHDHIQYLGADIVSIAGEKAGILRPGVPAVIAPQPDQQGQDALLAHAAALGAPADCGGRDWQVIFSPDGRQFRLGRPEGVSPFWPQPGLPGQHQCVNAATALVALEHFPSCAIPVSARIAGLRQVEWPARLQHLHRGPLVTAAPDGWEIWLDGGHNDSAGEVLARHAQRWSADGRPLHLIFGMLASKQPEAFLAPLLPWIDQVRTVPVAGEEQGLSAPALAAIASQAGCGQAAAATDPQAALAALVENAARNPDAPPARILICGSLYLAGAILHDHG